MTIGLGIDTGGTFTDSVLLDMGTREVLAKSKSRTTHGDLAKGIRGSLMGLDPGMLRDVDVVSLSSTLATNSIVEGRHGRVALVSIGREYGGEAVPDFKINISGGHGIHGGENERLDIEAARSFIGSVRGKVDAFAISSLMSIRNPEHELAVRDLVDGMLGIPAVCGHELSSSLGFNVRGSTCVINAGLIPVMSELMDAVRSVLEDFDIEAPLMVVRGNGSLMGESAARRRPVETVMSGPTASMMGAVAMTGLKDAIVVDIGGTTTDIGVICGGIPSVDAEGITVGGKRTHIAAARITTAGMGGDSRLHVYKGAVAISPIRALPLCVAARTWPEVLDHLRRTDATDYEMFVSVRDYDGQVYASEKERMFMEMASLPMSRADAAVKLGCQVSDLDVDLLERFGYMRRIAFTPTDLLASMGVYTEMGTEASELGAGFMAKTLGTDVGSMQSQCRDAIILRIGRELIRTSLKEDAGTSDIDGASEFLIRSALFGNGSGVMRCRLGFDSPMVGIGASSKVYVKWVADALGTEAVFGEDSDVGNAIGAICTPVSETLLVSIIPQVLDVQDSGFEIYTRNGRTEVQTMAEALRIGIGDAERRIREDLESQDVTDIEFTEKREDVFIPGRTDRILMEVRISVTGTGRPRPFRASRGRAS